MWQRSGWGMPLATVRGRRAAERLRNSGPAHHRICAPIALFYGHLLNSRFAVTQEVTQSHSRFDFVSSKQ